MNGGRILKNKAKFKEYMATLGEIHDKTISPMMMELYWKILGKFADADCERAFKSLIISARFFPKPIDVLEAIQGKQENRATEAWLSVLQTIKRAGNYQSIRFSDTAIHSVIQAMGGWPQICQMLTGEEKWKQKEFEKLYNVISERPSSKHPPYLPGSCEIESNARGYQFEPEIVSIGFEGQKLIEASAG
jgi:hypothetical protein